MSGFSADVAAQPEVIRRVVAAASSRLDGPLDAAAAVLRREPERPIAVVGMGSSLSAGRVVASILAPAGRVAMLEDAGEFLHYGIGATAGLGCLVAVSQSGRSVETVRVVERVRGSIPIVAVVNDASSPVAAAADVVLDLDAGTEAAVATRTYVATVAVLALLAGRVVPGRTPGGPTPGDPTPGDLARAADGMDLQLAAAEGLRGARHLEGRRALVIVGRGPGLGAADYAALTIKETAAIPAESLSGGAFRHGPLELATTDLGFVVLAPGGATASLGAGLAREIAALGGRTWLLADPSVARVDRDPPQLLTTTLPDLPEPLAQLACAIPLQQAAGELARVAGRRAGVTVVATKVTDRE